MAVLSQTFFNSKDNTETHDPNGKKLVCGAPRTTPFHHVNLKCADAGCEIRKEKLKSTRENIIFREVTNHSVSTFTILLTCEALIQK